MPVHFEDVDVPSQVEGLSSALIVPCNLCPAVTVATRQGRPFLRLFRSLLASAPFEEHLAMVQSRLAEVGIRTQVFRSRLYHQWFMCMWTSRRRRQLAKQAAGFDAVVVLGCASATETVREVVPTEVKVVEGMKMTGIMNGKIRVRWPGELVFDDCKVVPTS